MRSPLALAALLLTLAACSNETPPIPLDADTRVRDATKLDGAPLDAGDDRPGPIDAGALLIDDPPASRDLPGPFDIQPDVQTPDVVDAWVPIDDGPPVVDRPDAGELVADVADVGPLDVGTDVAADQPDVVDAPTDGGPVVYDLNEVTSTPRAVLLWGLVCFSRDCTADRCNRTATPGECRFASDGLHFSVDACGVLTGLVSVGSGAVGVQLGVAAITNSTSVTTRAGTQYMVGGVSRRNFHVQFTAPAVSSGQNGVTGIPGRTVSPTLGDVWLFGCRVE